MTVLIWLLIPLSGAVVAAVWSAWATRRRHGTGKVADSAGVAGYQAFREAMERTPGRDVATAAPADG
jgi:hypothetical protein